jgi:toxin ParE1/3/4
MNGDAGYTEYEVILETTAVLDLYGILDYITDVLKAPESAQRVYSSIKKQVMSLDHMPARHSVVRDEPYASIGVRMMPVENYIAFYVIDEQKHEVHVIRILYNRREWQNLL